MSKEAQQPEGCDPNTVAACMVRFTMITDKLDEMHVDIKSLEKRVMNGLTDRVNHVEGKVNRLADSDERREKFTNRLMLIVSGLIVSIGATAIIWTAKHFAQHNTPQQIQKP